MMKWMEAARKRLLSSSQGSAEIAETDALRVMAVSADPRRQPLRVVPGRSAEKLPERGIGGQSGGGSQVVSLGGRPSRRKRVRLFEELAEESRKRFHFCETHARMKGGICPHLGGRQNGDCLLWQIVTSEPKLEKIAEVSITKGVTIGGALSCLRENRFPEDLFQRDRRWILELSKQILVRQL